VLEDVDRVEPPADPAAGSSWALASQPEGAWAGHGGAIATWHPEGWRFAEPKPGFLAWDRSASGLRVFDGAGWTPPPAPDQAPILGVNTSADEANRLAVKSEAVLLSHDDVTPGTGDMRLVINKASAAGAAELVFQSGWSARALFGLSGDECFVIKLSADGAAFEDALALQPGQAARFGAPVAPPAHLLAEAPAAADHEGAVIRLLDAPGGPALALSDGTHWRPVGAALLGASRIEVVETLPEPADPAVLYIVAESA